MDSIVGRFLEHSRLYYFEGNGNEEIYLSSADMMTRNLNRRVEELYPVEQADTKEKAISILDDMWKDNVKARVLVGDHYERIDNHGEEPFNSQEFFVQRANVESKQTKRQEKSKRHFSNVFETLSRHVPSLHLDSRKGERHE